MEPEDVEMAAPPELNDDNKTSVEMEDMKKRLKEMEDEAAALREMQAKVEKEMSSAQDPTVVAAEQANKEEVDSRSIFVGNVDYACTPEEVQQHFQSCGTVNRVTIRTNKYGQPKGYAYVEFIEAEAVQEAIRLNESELHGRQLKYMQASLKAAAVSIGRAEWGTSGPHDSGQYNQFPEDTGFFQRDGTWDQEYGQFFLSWYSGLLLDHGDKLLEAAKGIFKGTGAKLSGKIAGIHWHYKFRSHATELTAGSYNTRNRDGYLATAQMFSKHEAIFNFTCLEMKDSEQQSNANSSPEGLVLQVKKATKTAGTKLSGENALERYDSAAYDQVQATSRSDSGNGLNAFTFLRMNKKLFESDNWRHLVEFVKNMSNGGRKKRGV